MEEILTIDQSLDKRVKRLEGELQEIDDKFEQSMARMDIKEKNGKLNENDLKTAIRALKEFREDGDGINEKIIRTERKMRQRKSST